MKIKPYSIPSSAPWRLKRARSARPSPPRRPQRIAISVVRNDGYTETISMDVFRDGVDDARNYAYVERIVKTMLWAYGGYKIVVAGSRALYEGIRDAYAVGGAREFDRDFMSRQYERPFEVEYAADAADAPAQKRCSRATGRHLDGCRIGFDAGGSDRKVSAVVDGKVVYSDEVVWHPKLTPTRIPVSGHPRLDAHCRFEDAARGRHRRVQRRHVHEQPHHVGVAVHQSAAGAV